MSCPYAVPTADDPILEWYEELCEKFGFRPEPSTCVAAESPADEQPPPVRRAALPLIPGMARRPWLDSTMHSDTQMMPTLPLA